MLFCNQPINKSHVYVPYLGKVVEYGYEITPQQVKKCREEVITCVLRTLNKSRKDIVMECFK